MIADFQSSRALVSFFDIAGPGSIVEVYNVKTGQLVGRSLAPEFPGDMELPPFVTRLSANGQAYYYPVRWGGAVIRSVETGKMVGPDLTQDQVWIADMLLRSAQSGYVMGRDGSLYRLRGEALLKVPENPTVGGVRKLVESANPSIQPVIGDSGWGVLDAQSGQWLMARDENVDLYSSPQGLAAHGQNRGVDWLKTYSFAGRKPTLTGTFKGRALEEQNFVCANAYGVMTHEDGDFSWHRAN